MKNIRKYFFWVNVAILLCWGGYMAYSAQPTLYTLKTFNDFLPGKMDKVSLLSDGRLCLSPKFQLVCNSGEPYIWDMARDSRNNLFLATGNDGRIYKITSDGDTSVFFDAPEFEVYALAIDKQDRLYAATSPRGKVYRIGSDGRAAVFFNPQETYIWDLALDANGDLLVATGAKAKLFRVKPNGSNQLIHQSEAEHIRCLAIDAQNRIYWGTARPGRIYCLQANDRPFAIYDANEEEVHQLATAKDGKIFAAIFLGRAQDKFTAGEPQQEKSRTPSETEDEIILSTLSLLVEEGPKAKSQLLMLSPEGYATNLWHQSEDVQTILASEDEVLVGVSKNGRLYRVNRRGETSLVYELGQTHISALLKTNDNKLYVATSNMGQCFLLHSTLCDHGSYETPPIDGKLLSQWGVIQWRGKGTVTFFTRSGNTQQPEGTWSPWESVENDHEVLRIKSPVARFLQLRCELQNKKGKEAEISEVTISYQQKNLPPEIGEITIHPVNVYLGTAQNPDSAKGIVMPQPLPKEEVKKGYCSVSWQFSDPNNDALLFDLYYRKSSDKFWRPFVKEYAGNYYSWDSNQLQDGAYVLKIVATDAADLPLGEGLFAERLSQEFIVDNTGPVIKIDKPIHRSSEILVNFNVCDGLTPLAQVAISINAQKWQKLNPDDGICDSPCENFTLKQSKGVGPVELAIKAVDRCQNISIVHTTLTDSN